MKEKTNELSKRNKGFTLIELLVVVLIIGILAAVALPQYRLAVDKTKMTQLIVFANSVRQAQQRYYLVNGSYANNWNDIDINLEGYTTDGYDSLWKGSLQDSRKNPYAFLNYHNEGLYFFGGDSYLPGILLIVSNKSKNRNCYANETNERAQTLCKHVCKNSTLGTDGQWRTCSF